ncbi:serine/threonine protein kinase [Streptosporangium becharense]|uniref:non-specific serine/threonine protein kinase n=1 Tax=Streptosporangium becharense TaxID=1816182 RepID=A0A7W9IJY5_9ACTN|nr:serine/threonine-protein kinase [Streptosporangium becharense]MBB2913170.1 serine/threonine protein kinase [Streptosporangium becharense]MBB5822153.1 serine/threonine protein kinase [Streptosporangium becharense]
MTNPHSERVVAGRYRLLRELGRGGMGVVWEGYDTLLNRAVAIKEVLLPPNLSAAEHQVQLTRTSREARTAARLNHHGIVAIYDVAEEDGRPWIIMELVRARALDQVGRLPVPQVAEIGRQVLSALRAAHDAGILHRDVKPSNILLDETGRAVLSDFGIAVVEGDTSLTQTGMVTGSPSFLPPERATGTAAGPWSDLWALGATLYATLVGRGPFERRDAIATLSALLTEEPDFRPVPVEMRAVLMGMLQREPAHRLTAQQADALLAEVVADPAAAVRRTGEWESRQTGERQNLRTGPSATPPPGFPPSQPFPGAPSSHPPFPGVSPTLPPERRRRGAGRVPLILAAVAVLAVGGGAVAVAMSGSGSENTAGSRPTSASTSAAAKPERTRNAERDTPTPRPTPTRTTAAPAPGAALGLRTWRARPPENWSISYPAGWTGDWSPETGYTQWLRRDGGAHMSVELLEGSTEGLEQLQRTVRENAAQWSEIHSEDTAAVPLAYGSGLQWEFTWSMKDSGGAPWAKPGVTYHEVRRFVAVGDTAIVLSWTTHDDEWQAQRALMNRIFASFHPRGGE